VGGDVKSKFRKIIFWIHLAAGISAGIVIAIMSFTGVMLAFEKEIIAWAERDSRHVSPPSPGTPRLSIDELLDRVRERFPGERPSAITVEADPGAAILFSFGRTNALYVSPYNGEIREPSATRVRGFMQTMIEWHRYLGTQGERRPAGKAITGAANAMFCFLAISGLYLWWPRTWTKEILRSVSLLNLKGSGKARDWNWHNAIGLWCAPVLIILTLTALPISYRWAGDLIYKLTGTTAPQPGAGAAAGSGGEVPAPPAGAARLGYEPLFAAAQKEVPHWKQILLRIAPGGRGGTANSGPQAVTFAVKEQNAWPRFSTVQVSLDPFTGAALRQENFSDYNLGRKIRSWTRFLHTGEALGPIGQAIAGIASLGAVILVWTGLALAFRRFFVRQSKSPSNATEPHS
jgi:uncharacterized iron-regulated membrane protein